MELLEEDIDRISARGHLRREFSFQDDEGYILLRNRDGRCVFHDGSGCTIYPDRPSGCRTYPLIVNMENGECVWDDDCPHTAEFVRDPEVERSLRDNVDEIMVELERRSTGRL